MTTTLSADGKIAIPPDFRAEEGIAAGQCFELTPLSGGSILLTRRCEAPAEGDLEQWLLSCPVKDWFEEPDRSEMIDIDKPSPFEP